MKDDSIGINVLEKISPLLKEKNIEVVFGETDINYALSKIDVRDLLFIIDSTYFDIDPGTVTFTPIEKVIIQNQQVYSQHQISLINLLKMYNKSVKGYVIGIEVEEIDFSVELSETLKDNFSLICEEVLKFIYGVIKGI